MTATRAAVLLTILLLGCPGRKQVPFGLEEADPGPPAATPVDPEQVEVPEYALAVGEVFEEDQVEVAINDAVLVLESGYAIGALRLDLDVDEVADALVVSAGAEEVRLTAAYSRGTTVQTRSIDSFRVPVDCEEPTAELSQLSESLVGVVVRHACSAGPRENIWIVSLETQPRVRERLTVLPPNSTSGGSLEVRLRVEDRDSDGYDDVIAEAKVGTVEIQLAWLDRPGGFARDVSEPEATFEALTSAAAQSRATNAAEAEALASGVVAAFEALCREAGAARLGVSGVQGLQCLNSPATAKAVGIVAASAIARGDIVRALEVLRIWERPSTRPSAADRATVDAAWTAANAKSRAVWKKVDSEAGSAPLRFESDDVLWIGGPQPRTIDLSTGTRRELGGTGPKSSVVDPEGRFQVLGVRWTCAGYEAEIAPVRGRQNHRVAIERRSETTPCTTPVDRPVSSVEWGVLGWAPQGLVVARDDRLRIVPLNSFAKPAGTPFDLSPGSPLPAPIRGARITPDGSRYAIPRPEGILVRDTRRKGGAVWLRPADWDSVRGTLDSVAINPSATLIALQKGSEIRVVSW